jgi:outer membrane protein assembly factor BamE (lipoprotein component of BamABCDE complex)
MVKLKTALALVLVLVPFGLAACAGPAGTADDPFVDEDGNKMYIDDNGWTIYPGLVYSSQIIRKINLDMTVRDVTNVLGTPSAEGVFGRIYVYHMHEGRCLQVTFFASEGLVPKMSDMVSDISLYSRDDELIAAKYRQKPQGEIKYKGIWPVE